VVENKNKEEINTMANEIKMRILSDRVNSGTKFTMYFDVVVIVPCEFNPYVDSFKTIRRGFVSREQANQWMNTEEASKLAQQIYSRYTD
jgi:uncharacterized protein (DUF2225 family)